MGATDAALSVGMVAGEASGDVLAALLLGGLRERWPGLSAQGIGGPRMVSQGFDAWWPSDKLAVRGYVEVLRHYREIVAIRRQLLARWQNQPPALFVGVDAPDFNLDLELSLKAKGVKTVHFVAPAIWAWRAERIEKIRRATDHVLCIFPFEPAIFERQGVPATYVGHPLAQTIPLQPDRAAARQALGLPSQATVVALMPGSRQAEIDHLADRFLQAARLMRLERPELRFAMPAAPGLHPILLRAVERAGMGSEVMVTEGRAHQALAACDITLIASGTATLEAALFKRPMVIAYHMNPLSWWLTRRKMLQPWVGLPNILCGESVVPELLQDRATPKALADQTLAVLDSHAGDPARLQALESRFSSLHELLRRDTAQLAADAIEKTLAH